MDSMNTKSRLKDLSTNLTAKQQLEESIYSLKNKLQYEKTRPAIKVEQFDLANKEKFIKSRVGEKPVAPNKSLAIFVPVYLKKKKEYEEALEKYYLDVQKATNSYFSTYEMKRHELLNEDNQERAKAIEELTFKLTSAEKKFASILALIEQDDIVGKSLKNTENVLALIEIFDNRRADSIKEAINVLYEDKHRKKMEELQEEQVRLTQEAKDAAEEATRVATEAYEKAEEALDRADDAHRRADDAWYKADDAYDKANDALNNSNNSYYN